MKGSSVLSESILTGLSIVISFILIVLVIKTVVSYQADRSYKNLLDSIGRDITARIDKLSSTTGSGLIEYEIPKGTDVDLRIDYKSVFVSGGEDTIKKTFSGKLNSGPYEFSSPEVLCFAKSKYDNIIVIVDEECSCDVKPGVCDIISVTTTTSTTTSTTITLPEIMNLCEPEVWDLNQFPPPGQGVFQCHASDFGRDYISGWDLLLNWKDIEPEEDNYDFSKVEDFIQKLYSNKKRGYLNFITYTVADLSGTPQWVYDKGAKKLNFGNSAWGIMPVPWNEMYKTELKDALTELNKELQEKDPCKLIEVIQMSAGGPWGDVSIYTTNYDWINIWMKAADPNFDTGNLNDRKQFSQIYSNSVAGLVDVYEESITDRPIVLISPQTCIFECKDEDQLPDYSIRSIKKYGGRLYVKVAGVGKGSDCGSKIYFGRYCKEVQGVWPFNCDFNECPATRCLYEPHGTLSQFEQYGCDYEETYVSMPNNAISTKASMFCIYGTDLRNPNLESTHQKIDLSAGAHIKVLSTNILKTSSKEGKILLSLELSGNLPPFIFEREGVKDVPRSMKIKIYLKQNNEYTDIGFFEPTPSSLTWKGVDYRYSNQASPDVTFNIPEDIQSGDYQIYASFYDPTYYYNWPVTGISMDEEHRFYIGDFNIE